MSPAAPASRPPDEAYPATDWGRFGWLLAAVWVLFLGFPLRAALTAPDTMGLRAVAALLVLVFGAAYVAAFRRLPIWVGIGEPRLRLRVSLLALLVALALVEWPLIGVSALTMSPFVIGYAAFMLPRHWAFAVLALWVALGALATRSQGSWATAADLAPVTITVLVSGVLTQTVVRREIATEHLEREMLLMGERGRMARDVHDLLGHSLTVIHLKSQLAARLVRDDPDRAISEMAAIGELSREALDGVRQTVSGERGGGLPEVLDECVTTLRGAGIATTVHGDVHAVTGRIVLPLALVLRELTTNLLRHACASRCELSLAADRLVVDDDGLGWQQHREGNGLRGVRERLAPAGGTLTTSTSPLGGARAEVTW